MATISRTRRVAPFQPPSRAARSTSAVSTPTITNAAPVYAWTAAHATAAVVAARYEVALQSSSTRAVATFAKMVPIVGFQITAAKHRSYAAVATRTIVASAVHA